MKRTFPRQDNCLLCHREYTRTAMRHCYCSDNCLTAVQQTHEQVRPSELIHTYHERSKDKMTVCKVCKRKFTTNTGAEMCGRECTDAYYAELEANNPAFTDKPLGETTVEAQGGKKPRGGISVCGGCGSKACDGRCSPAAGNQRAQVGEWRL